MCSLQAVCNLHAVWCKVAVIALLVALSSLSCFVVQNVCRMIGK